MNTVRPSRPPSYAKPHYRQAHKWARYARILRQIRMGVHPRKEEALSFSLEKARSFVVPAKLECAEGHARGLWLLMRTMTELKYPEVEAKIIYDDTAETERVEVYVHTSTPAGGFEKAPIGRLPSYDAQWIAPLLRDHEAGKWLRLYVAGVTGKDIQVVITSAHHAAHYWMDGYDDRKAALETKHGGTHQERAVAAYMKTHRSGSGSSDTGREIARLQKEIQKTLIEINAREEVGLPCSKKEDYLQYLSAQVDRLRTSSARRDAERIDEPTVEDWLREDVGLREVPFSHLPKEDYWAIHNEI